MSITKKKKNFDIIVVKFYSHTPICRNTLLFSVGLNRLTLNQDKKLVHK